MKFIKMRIAADIATKCFDFVFRHFILLVYFLIPIAILSLVILIYVSDGSYSSSPRLILLLGFFSLIVSVIEAMRYILDIFAGKKAVFFSSFKFGLRERGIINTSKITGLILLLAALCSVYAILLYHRFAAAHGWLSVVAFEVRIFRFLISVVYLFLMLLLAISLIRKKSFTDSFKAWIAAIPKVWLALIVCASVMELMIWSFSFPVFLLARSIPNQYKYLYLGILIVVLATLGISAIITFVTTIAAYTQGHPIAKELDLFGLKKYQD